MDDGGREGGRGGMDGSGMDRWAGREGGKGERGLTDAADDDALLGRPSVRPTDFHSLRGIFQSLNRKERSV